MLFDVAAEVTANTRLSPDYNVIALEAPDIARAATPGQFVMVTAGRPRSAAAPAVLDLRARHVDASARRLASRC
jgi:NAD(P)H-flavin reductase